MASSTLAASTTSKPASSIISTASIRMSSSSSTIRMTARLAVENIGPSCHKLDQYHSYCEFPWNQHICSRHRGGVDSDSRDTDAPKEEKPPFWATVSAF